MQAHTRAPFPPAILTLHVPHPPRSGQDQDRPPRTATTDRVEEPPRTTHNAPPQTTRTKLTQSTPPQPTAPPTATCKHTEVPPLMRHTAKTLRSQPTRPTMGHTKETPGKTHPQSGPGTWYHPVAYHGSTPRPSPSPPQPWTRYIPPTHSHSPPTGAAPGPQHARDAATHQPADPTDVAVRTGPADGAPHAPGPT